MFTLISAFRLFLASPRSRRLIMGALAATLMACTNLADKGPLYQQLGGPEGIKSIMGRTLDRVAQHDRMRRSFEGVKMSTLKSSVSEYVCQLADGPCTYRGDAMGPAHASLNIVGSEFEFMVEVLRDELDAAGVSNAAKNELLKRLAPTKRDIVKS